jgi:hypothetical protein
MRTLLAAMLVLGAGATALALHARAGRTVEERKKVDTRFFEMRTYHAAPGKMKALHARFRDHTCALFKKHGMTIVGFWSPADPAQAEKTLVYILAYPSKQAREESWKAFRADPDWQKVLKESEKDGKLVDRVDSLSLTPTDYSPIQ